MRNVKVKKKEEEKKPSPDGDKNGRERRVKRIRLI